MTFRNSGYILLTAIVITMTGYGQGRKELPRVRPLADTVGFAHLDWQMDSIMTRLARYDGQDRATSIPGFEGVPRVVICPHDDYSYVGDLYPAALKNIRARIIIIFGVAHKAKLLNLENQVIFDSYDYWRGPYGPVKVSDLREKIMKQLPAGIFQVNDSMQRIEHSVEAVIPFLQYYDRDVQIVSVLVPYMSYERMTEIAKPLSEAIKKATIDEGLAWGKDFAIVISTDAVHYGDEDWGGRNYAPFGTDSAGYARATAHEREIMDTLSGNLVPNKVKSFCSFTVDEKDYHEYKWTWCGRYSVPLGLLTAYDLNEEAGGPPLIGCIIGYSNSISHPALRVDDLDMGQTAIATMRHWVGYAALGYK